MKITRIAKVGTEDKFAIFLDGTLKLFLSGQSILKLGLNVGQEMSEAKVKEIKSLSANDELYLKALKYLSVRLRSEDELRQYLKRKEASTDQQKAVVLRLKKMGLIDDEKFVEAFIHDKLLASPSSKRKIAYALKKKHIASDIIARSLNNDQISDRESLAKLIEIKRRQAKYQDDLRLMQYLVRNGFNYGDVKVALGNSTGEY